MPRHVGWLLWALVAIVFWYAQSEKGLWSTPEDEDDGVIGAEDRVELAAFTSIAENGDTLTARHFRASVLLTCGEFMGSASVVGDPSVIVFSAHQVLTATGAFEEGLEDDCAIVVDQESANPTTIPVDVASIRTGALVIEKDGEPQFGPAYTIEDWAVARLERPAPVTPYKLWPTERPFAPEQPIVNVSEVTVNWPDGDYDGRLAQRCRLVNAAEAERSEIGKYDCDTGSGASGSGMLVASSVNDIRIIGVLTESDVEDIEACERGEAGACTTDGPTLHDALRAAIQDAIAQPSG